MPELLLGYVGLGTIGLRVASRLAAAGHRLIVCDAAPGRAQALCDSHAKVTEAGTPAEVAATPGLSALFVCLPDPAAGDQVLLGPSPDSVVSVAPAGLVVVDNSTVDAETAARLHRALWERGVAYLECPVLGGAAQAEEGTLFAVLSGDADAYAQVQSLLPLFSREHRFVSSEPGAASTIKSVQNGLGLIQWAGMVEALGLVAKSGVDLATFYDVVTNGGGMADTNLFRAQARKIIDGDMSFNAHLRIGAKDIGLANSLAAKHGIQAPTFAAANSVFQAAMAMGLGEKEIAELARVVERSCGATIIGAGKL